MELVRPVESAPAGAVWMRTVPPAEGIWRSRRSAAAICSGVGYPGSGRIPVTLGSMRPRSQSVVLSFIPAVVAMVCQPLSSWPSTTRSTLV